MSEDQRQAASGQGQANYFGYDGDKDIDVQSFSRNVRRLVEFTLSVGRDCNRW